MDITTVVDMAQVIGSIGVLPAILLILLLDERKAHRITTARFEDFLTEIARRRDDD